jgi:hypothetical protein
MVSTCMTEQYRVDTRAVPTCRRQEHKRFPFTDIIREDRYGDAVVVN